MSAFADALGEVGARIDAATGSDPESEEVVVVDAKPSDLIRRVLSGYVAIDETDEVLEFLTQMSEGTARTLWKAAGPEAAKASLRFTGAQLLALGVAIERKRASDA